MKRLSTPGRAASLTVLAPISWGTTYVTITELLPDGRPLLVATFRVLPAGLVLVLLGSFASQRSERRQDGALRKRQTLHTRLARGLAPAPPVGTTWRRTALLGAFNFGLFFPLLAVAVYRLPGGVAAAAGGLQPLLVATLTWLVSGRRPRPADLLVGVVAAVGVTMVVIRPGAGFDTIGLAAALAANVSFAAGVVLVKHYPAPSNPLSATGWQMLLGGVLLVPLTAAVEAGVPPLTGRNLAGFAYLSLAATALAFVLWTHGVRRLPSAGPPLLGLAAPTTGAALGWVLLGESLSPLQLLGFAVTLGAIARGATLRPTTAGPPSSPQPTPKTSPQTGPQTGAVMQVTTRPAVSVSRT